MFRVDLTIAVALHSKYRHSLAQLASFESTDCMGALGGEDHARLGTAERGPDGFVDMAMLVARSHAA